MARKRTDYQSPSSGQKGDCATTVKIRKVGGKTRSVTSRGKCAGELSLFERLSKVLRAWAKATK